MKREYFEEVEKVGSSSIAKLGKNQIVSIEVLLKICEALDCNIGDIVDAIK